jgi:ribonuclease HII
MHKRQPVDWWEHERAALNRGFRIVCGIDEAGRGPLAGPVVAAAVVLPFEAELPGVRDSKKMTPEQRADAYDMIRARAAATGIGIVDHAKVDTLNILRATHHAMRLALEQIDVRPEFALIDGLPVHPFPILQSALVKGDGRSVSIAAASILAKVTRDRIMEELDTEYPQYGFRLHKGYPTPEHLVLLERHGPCPVHRRSFAPVARLCPELAAGPQTQMGLFNEERRAAGEAGEAMAAAHLRRLGYEVLCSRYRCREGEVDLVARDGETTAFVEVKARRGRHSSPAESVGYRKRSRLVAAARAWVDENGAHDLPCRFDIAEVFLHPDGNGTVNVIKGAFFASE